MPIIFKSDVTSMNSAKVLHFTGCMLNNKKCGGAPIRIRTGTYPNPIQLGRVWFPKYNRFYYGYSYRTPIFLSDLNPTRTRHYNG